jgi:hypothetical protein
MAEAMGRQARLSDDDRLMLVKLLGMLGSDHDGEVVNAARQIEKLRRQIGLTWDELIVAAAQPEQMAA